MMTLRMSSTGCSGSWRLGDFLDGALLRGVDFDRVLFFFAAFAVGKPEAVAFSWIAYGMVVLQGVIGGVVYNLRR